MLYNPPRPPPPKVPQRAQLRMVDATFRRLGRMGMGDDISDSLEVPAGQFVTSYNTPQSSGSDALMIPGFAQTTNTGSASSGSSGSPAWYTQLGQTAITGLLNNLFGKPAAAATKPAAVIAAPSSGISTGLVVAGVGAAALIGVLIYRSRKSS